MTWNYSFLIEHIAVTLKGLFACFRSLWCSGQTKNCNRSNGKVPLDLKKHSTFPATFRHSPCPGLQHAYFLYEGVGKEVDSLQPEFQGLDSSFTSVRSSLERWKELLLLDFRARWKWKSELCFFLHLHQDGRIVWYSDLGSISASNRVKIQSIPLHGWLWRQRHSSSM